MSSTASVTITSKYADGKTRKTVLSPISVNATTHVKERIIARNDKAFRDENYTGFDSGFVSDNGAEFIGFTAAQITVTNRTVIF